MITIKTPYSVYLLAFMWLVQLIQSFIWPDIIYYGILPRTFEGLIGIAFAPWLHHGWWHLISNSIPFVILGLLVQLKGNSIFWETTLLISIISGIITWCLGSSAYHVGASALVLGYWSFLLAEAYYSRSIKSLLIASLVLLIYSGFLFALLDLRAHISWIGHAGGLLAGIIVAKFSIRQVT